MQDRESNAAPMAEVLQVVWQLEDEKGVLHLQPTNELRLRSIESASPLYLRFANNTPYSVRVLWLDYKGNESTYELVKPGGVVYQHTFLTHPWIVREVTTSTRLLLDNRPAVLAHYNKQTHTFYPAPFKEAVRTFLLAHQHLQRRLACSCHGYHSEHDTGATNGRIDLGHIPHLLLPHIVELAAPFTPQGVHYPAIARPDILPALLEGDCWARV
eukprot:gene13376-13503_t